MPTHKKHNYPTHINPPPTTYYHGLAVPVNHKNARIRYLLAILEVDAYVKYYKIAAKFRYGRLGLDRKMHERKQRKARYGLGASFYHGEGVRQSYRHAAEWLHMALDWCFPWNDDTRTWLRIEGADSAYNDINRIVVDYSPKRLKEEAEELSEREKYTYLSFDHRKVAETWKTIKKTDTAEKKTKLYLELARRRMNGHGVLKDEKEAFKLYREAARCAKPYTHSGLEELLDEGKATPCIYFADDFWKKAANDIDNTSTAWATDRAYRIELDFSKLFYRTDYQNFLNAMMALKCYAECYMYGIGVARNWKKAADILIDAAYFEEARMSYYACLVVEERNPGKAPAIIGKSTKALANLVKHDKNSENVDNAMKQYYFIRKTVKIEKPR